MAIASFKGKHYDTQYAYERNGLLRTHNKKTASLIKERETISAPLARTNLVLQKKLLRIYRAGKKLTPAQEKALVTNIALFLGRVEVTATRVNLTLEGRQTGLSRETSRLLHSMIKITGIQMALLELERKGLVHEGIYARSVHKSKLSHKGHL